MRKRVAHILFFKIRPSQQIQKIRDGTPMEAEEILIYIKSPQNKSVWHFCRKLDVPSNVVQKERVAQILFFKIWPSQEILKIRDGTPLEAEEILIYIKKPSKQIVQKKRVARILFFKIRPSQEILKIRYGTPLEVEEILIYIKKPSKKSVWHFSSNLDVRTNVVQRKRVAHILFFKIRPSQQIQKIRDGTLMEAEEILIYIKSPQNKSVWHFCRKLDVSSNVVQKERVAQILFFKIRPSQEILKIRDGTPMEAEEILIYIKKPSKQIVKKRVARILFFKIRPSQEILKIRYGTPLEAEEILIYIKKPSKKSVWHFSSNLDVRTNVVQRKRVAHILFFKIRPSQEIQKIRDGTPMEAEEILIYIKSPQNKSVWPSQEILKIRDDVPSNVVQKKRVARILFFKIRPSQEILKIRYGTPLEVEEILIYIKKPSKKLVWHFSSNLDVRTNVVQRKRVAHILFFKIRPSQQIQKIRDGTPMEAEEILIYIKSPQNKSVWHFCRKLDVPSNVVQKERVAQILFFKIRPSQEILKIRDGTPLEAEEILIYIKKPSKQIEILKIRDDLDKKRVARILFFKIRPSQEILKIRYGTPLEVEEILIYIKKPSKKSVWHFSSNLDVRTNVVQRKRVAHILFFKIRPSQQIQKIRDGTLMEAEEILIYIKSPQNKSVWHFCRKLDVSSNVVQKERVAQILFFKIRPSQEILKIRDGTPLEKRVARILFFKIRPSQEILKIRYGTPLEAEEILIYIKKPSKKSVWHFSSNLDVRTNVVQRKRVAHILFFKIRPSQEIQKIRDGTPMEAEEILIYIKSPQNKSVCVQKKRVARILFFKIRPSQEILKIRYGTPLEVEEILIYIKKPSKKLVWHFSSNLDVRTNVVQRKRVAHILFFKIRPSQQIQKIRDGTPMEAEEILIYIKSPQNKSVWHFCRKLDVPSNVVQKERVAQILFFKIRPSQEILKIRDGTPLEAEEILIYIKKPSKQIVQKKRVARILFFKIRPSQEILKIRYGTPLEVEEILIYIKKPSKKSVWHFSSNLDVRTNVVQRKRVAHILFFKIRPSQQIQKIRDGTLMEAEEILIYIKSPQNKSVWHFCRKLDVSSNVVQKERVAQILFFKIRPSQEILKIRDGTPLEKERVARILFFKIRPSQEILKIRDVQKKRVARILFFKIRPSQEILKIRYGTPLEVEEILIYIKKPSKKSVWHFSSNLDVRTNVVQRKRVAHILFFKIRPSQQIQKIRDGTLMEAEEILIYIKSPQNKSVWHFCRKLDVSSNVVQKERVAQILFFKIRPSQEILKIRDGTPLEAEEILIYIKKPSKQIDVPSNVVQKKRVARILFFKIRPSQEILKIRYGTPLEAEEILIYIKKPSKKSVWHFSSNLDVRTNVVQRKRVAHILFFKIRPSQEIQKIRDGTPMEAEEILIYIKSPQNKSE
ncbi:hypothetical protein OROGR_005308 [Orobanche gracilis]